MIIHASISENGNAGWDGKAKVGDQTGKEVCSRTWYNKPWEFMLRCNDAKIAENAARIALKLANSNLVGYDQSNRNSLYKALKSYNFDVDKYIQSGIKTETDCSAFVYCVYACLMPELRYDDNAPTTSTMRKFLLKYGFKVYGDACYLISERYLYNGDILLKEGSHVVIYKGDDVNYYKPCSKAQNSIIDGLKEVGEKDTTLEHRKRLAVLNGVKTDINYSMNIQLLNKLKAGLLIKG